MISVSDHSSSPLLFRESENSSRFDVHVNAWSKLRREKATAASTIIALSCLCKTLPSLPFFLSLSLQVQCCCRKGWMNVKVSLRLLPPRAPPFFTTSHGWFKILLSELTCRAKPETDMLLIIHDLRNTWTDLIIICDSVLIIVHLVLITNNAALHVSSPQHSLLTSAWNNFLCLQPNLP